MFTDSVFDIARVQALLKKSVALPGRPFELLELFLGDFWTHLHRIDKDVFRVLKGRLCELLGERRVRAMAKSW